MPEKRCLSSPVVEDLMAKMVFVGGPRQVGKTTLARALVGARFKQTAYFFREKLNVPFAYQVLKKPGVDRIADRVRIISADESPPAARG